MKLIRIAAPALLLSLLGFPAMDADAADGDVDNGGLISFTDLRAEQRLDRLDGTSRLFPRVGSSAQFNPRGDKVLFSRFGVAIRSANGLQQVLDSPVDAIGDVSWASDESFVVASGHNFESDQTGIWKLVPGHRAKRLALLGTDDFPIDVEVRPGTHQVVYDFMGDLWTVDADTGARRRVLTACAWDGNQCAAAGPVFHTLLGLDWSRDGSRALLGYQRDDIEAGTTEAGFGWWAPGDGYPAYVLARPDASLPILSPDEQYVAQNDTVAGKDVTTILSLADGHRAGSVAGFHVDWQPCPNGTCAVFRDPVPPSRTPIKHASPGKKGGKRTAIVRWGAPARSGTTAVNDYMLVATRVGHGSPHRKITHRPRKARHYEWRLPKGAWKFRVCAYNSASSECVVSKYSNKVTSR